MTKGVVSVCDGAMGGGGLYSTLGNRDCQLMSRSILKDFTDEALTISAGYLFQNGTAGTLKAYWRRRILMKLQGN